MSDFIVPPPGLVPEAPHRAEPERTVRVPDRVPAPRPTGRLAPPIPPGSPVPPSAAVVPPVHRPGPRTAWRLRPDDGEGDVVTVTLSGRVVVGRDPRAADAAAAAEPVAIDDPARSVSKTHALLEVVDDRLLATDLRSTNGVRIWPEGEDAIELEPGRPTSVPEGAVLLLGDVAFLVERAPDPTV